LRVTDGLFGRCEGIAHQDGDLWRPMLDLGDAKLLESELERLWAQGYRWRHVYSQCVVRSALASIRHRRLYDPGFCSRTLRSTLPIVSDEIAMELDHLGPDDIAFIKFTPNVALKQGVPPQFADEVFFPPLDAPAAQSAQLSSGEVVGERDDTADADEAAASLSALKQALKARAAKRRYQGDKDDSNETGAGGRSEEGEDVIGVLDYLRQMARDTASLLDENTDRYDVFTPPDVPVVETQLSSDLDQKPIFTEGGIEWVPVAGENNDGDSSRGVSRTAEAGSTAELPDESRAASSALMSGDASESSDSEQQQQQLPAPWESEPHRWRDSGEDSHRMGWMDFPKDQPFREGDEDEILDIGLRQDPAFRRPMRYDTKKPGPTYFFHEPDSSETSNEIEQNVRRVMLRQQKLHRGANYGAEKDIDQEEAILEHLTEVGQANGKRHGLSIPGDNLDPGQRGSQEVGPTPDDLYTAIDAMDAFVVVDETALTQEDGDKLVSGLQRALFLPSGTFSNIRVDGSRVIFKVNPNSQNYNASTVAAKAESLTDVLRQKANLTIVAAGVAGEVSPH
ncbi:unnamed protein product, partial [Ixodes hexagonus]